MSALLTDFYQSLEIDLNHSILHKETTAVRYIRITKHISLTRILATLYINDKYVEKEENNFES